MTELDVKIHRENERGDIFTLLRPVRFYWRFAAFTAPKGFESDGVSVPRFAWATVTPKIDPRSLRAGVGHDYIYRHQPPGWTREQADRMFLCLLIEDGLSVPRALAAYTAVRAFGGRAWNQNQKLLEIAE